MRKAGPWRLKGPSYVQGTLGRKKRPPPPSPANQYGWCPKVPSAGIFTSLAASKIGRGAVLPLGFPILG